MAEGGVPKEVEELARELATPRSMRRGSLSERWVKCSKAGCACGDDAEARHGPYFSVTVAEGGQTRSRLVSTEQVGMVQEQIAAGRAFRKQVEAFRQACERWADTELAAAVPAENAVSKKKRRTAFTAEIVAEVEALIAPGAAVDFEAVEVAVRRRALAVAAKAVAQRFNADTSDYAGAQQPCACGQAARYAGRRAKQVTSVLGELKLERAYYHCASCGHGWSPRDQALGIVRQSLSPALTRMVGLVGALVSFEEGSELLSELAGISVGSKRVERTAEALGQAIAADERAHVEAVPNTEMAPTLYLGMDGSGVPMRATEVAGRAGKQADGSAKTREAKLCTVWSAQHCDADGLPVRDEGSVTYCAAIESAATTATSVATSEFAQRVRREATRRGFERAARRVILGDGAAWIWNLAEETHPDAIQIVDRFHAKQHLSDVAKAIYGTPSQLGDQWNAQRQAELDAGHLDALLAALVVHAPAITEARQCAEYFRKNRQRMRYPAFHAQGLCTSTGVVEAGCRVVIGTRLKRSGMRWTVRGANAIIALRCAKLSGNRFEEFWERRATGQAAA